MTPLDDKQAARLRVLLAYYELSDGEPRVFLEPAQIEKHTGLSAQEVDAARRYLISGGLVEERAASGVASISQYGVREAERVQGETRRRSRSTVLAAAYDLANASMAAPVSGLRIRQKTGLDEETIRDAVLFLHKRNLVQMLGDDVIALTAEGIRLVEAARVPEAAAPAAAAPVVMTFHAPVGAVQTGTGSTANVQQSIGFDADQLRNLIEAMRRSIPPDRPHLREAVDDLAEEASKPQAKQSKIRAYLTSAVTYGKDIAALVGVAKEIAKLLGVELP